MTLIDGTNELLVGLPPIPAPSGADHPSRAVSRLARPDELPVRAAHRLASDPSLSLIALPTIAPFEVARTS